MSIIPDGRSAGIELKRTSCDFLRIEATRSDSIRDAEVPISTWSRIPDKMHAAHVIRSTTLEGMNGAR